MRYVYLKPENSYPLRNYTEMDVWDAHSLGETIQGYLESFDPVKEIFIVRLGQDVFAKMKLEEFSIQPISETSVNGIPVDILCRIGQTIRVKVIKAEPNEVWVSRKENMKYYLEKIKQSQGKITSGNVYSRAPFGVYIDIGEGLRAFIHKFQMSCVKYDDVRNWVHLGARLQGRIEIVNERNCICLSRKKSYKKVPDFAIGDELVVKYYKNLPGDYEAVVEINPAIRGIVRFPFKVKSFSEGRCIKAKVVYIDEKKDRYILQYIL